MLLNAPHSHAAHGSARDLVLTPAADPLVSVFVHLSRQGAAQPLLGHRRMGRWASGRVPLSALERLAADQDVDYVEAAPRAFLTNDLATAPASARMGTLMAGGPDFFDEPIVVSAGETVSVSLWADPMSSLNPKLQICPSTAAHCAALAADDDSGPGNDAELRYTFPAAGIFFVRATKSTPAGGNYALVFHDRDHLPIRTGSGSKRVQGFNGGAGVIVGVIDTGIDVCHGDFIDDASGSSRILRLWDQSLTAEGSEVTPDIDGDGAPDYGVEYTRAMIDAARPTCPLSPSIRGVRSIDDEGHGTHVASLAAGDGSATNGAEPAGKYRGAAPQAELVVVKASDGQGGIDTVGVVDGIRYIFDIASALGRPAVINLSFGSYAGPLDGSGALDEIIAGFAGPGRVLVASAGNSGGRRVRGRGEIATSHTIALDLATCSGNCRGGQVNLWHHGDDAFAATLVAPNGATLDAAPGTLATASLDGVSVVIDNPADAASNGAKNLLLDIRGRGSGSARWALRLTRTLSGGNSHWDAWLSSGEPPVLLFANDADVPLDFDGSVAGTIGTPGTSFGAIAVGSFVGKPNWDALTGPFNIPGPLAKLGRVSSFSARGPTRDGRRKPDLVAPGEVTVAALSADCPVSRCGGDRVMRDARHLALQGTSMAAGVVTGAVALALALAPDSYPVPLFASTAATDASSEGFVPGNSWGEGKLDVPRALATLAADLAPSVALATLPAKGVAPLGVILTAAASDPDAGDGISQYLWDFEGDGITDVISTTAWLWHSYDVPGLYSARVTAVDRRGRVAIAKAEIDATPPPPPPPPPTPAPGPMPVDPMTTVAPPPASGPVETPTEVAPMETPELVGAAPETPVPSPRTGCACHQSMPGSGEWLLLLAWSCASFRRRRGLGNG